MSHIAIEFNNVGKMYRLGRVGTGTLSHDLNRWWQTTILGKEDPYLKIGQTNDRTTKGDSDYVWALKDISFKVEQGDVVGIIGKNGAGKSTLLKLLSNITSPTTGSIRYQGRIASLLEVGTGFHPEMTGRENIYMNGSIMGMTKTEITRKLDEIVDFAGVERYLDTPVKRYSSGMTVRLGFAVAAFLEPEILVVDEVLTVGDAEFQKKAIGKMQDVSRGEGRTVLFVSHNMAAVRSLCSKGIVLKNGCVDFQGSSDECVNHYMQSGYQKSANLSIRKMPRETRCTYAIRFTDFQILDRFDNPIQPHSGQFTKFRVCFEVNEEVKNCQIGLGIKDIMGNSLVSFPTEMTIEQLDFSKGKFYADCMVERLPLTEGCYMVALSAGIEGVYADYLYNCIRFEVMDDDFYGNGRTISSNLKGKVVLYDHKWKINSTEND